MNGTEKKIFLIIELFISLLSLNREKNMYRYEFWNKNISLKFTLLATLLVPTKSIYVSNTKKYCNKVTNF